ncbi:hypothetical protein Poli38472_008286 [Pythium oligandrum]|uniref:Uncharacterized protein n=1 Tax=Pythium oligandrum TaxID=41045 RepID=A0A8K1CM79_PYTOL|nr:hypothetical protein Poli38472_008286 [Pythium oligandrum]|eukprot:TMW65644.1 hypothetical protein Poli38472_008286 [Pythium oligandrum]
MANARKWTPDEHERFGQALNDNDLRSWREIAAFIGTRTVRQCISHFQKSKRKAQKRAEKARKKGKVSSPHWTQEECERLQQARCDSEMTWCAIAEAVGTRTKRQCISHYQKCKGQPNMHLREELKVLSDELNQWNQRARRSATRTVHQATEIDERAYTDVETDASDDARCVQSREESPDVSNDAVVADPTGMEKYTNAATEEPTIVLDMVPSTEEAVQVLTAASNSTTDDPFKEKDVFGNDSREAHQSINEEAINAELSAPFDDTDGQLAFAGELTTTDRLCAYIFNIDLVSDPSMSNLLFAGNEDDTHDFSLLGSMPSLDECFDGSNYQLA